jgi:lipoprotein-anchoring transpeptidase ErfK/SrfK
MLMELIILKIKNINMKNIFTLLLITAISFTSYAQEWEIVENRGPDGCYTTQIIETVEIKKKTALDSEKYHYIIKITFENPLDVGISFDFRYHDSYGENTGRITLKPGKKTTSETYREISRSVDWNTALNIQPIETSKLKYIDFEILGEKIWQSKYINCLEHFHIYKKAKMKEILDKKEKTTNTSIKEVDNTTTKNQGYQVLDVDTSEFEAEKLRKQKLSEEQTNRRYQENLKEENKAKLKAKQLEDAQNFIDNQNLQSANQEKLNQKLADDLNQTFTQISNSWAKEKEFQSKISSLTSIRSNDAGSIINEAKNKARQINAEYSDIKNDALNQSVNATQTLINSAQNENQAIAGGILGTLGTIASQSNLEKSRKDAQNKLRSKKEIALQELADKFAEPYRKSLNKNLELISLSLNKNDADYYTALAIYDECIITNALEIILGNSTCKLEQASEKPIIKTNFTGQEYYNAYQLKIKSTEKHFNKNAKLFLDLAIQKEPKNVSWLSESAKFYNITEKLAILKKCIELSNNKVYKDDYNNLLSTYSSLSNLLNEKISETKRRLKVEKLLTEKHGNNFSLVTIKPDENGFYMICYEKKNLNTNGDPKRKYGYINENAKIVVPVIYGDIGAFSNGLARASLKWKWGFVNTKGETIVEHKYKQKPYKNIPVNDFSKDDFAQVLIKNQVWNINKDGELFLNKSNPSTYLTVNNELFAQKKRLTRRDDEELVGIASEEVSENGKFGFEYNNKAVLPAVYEKIVKSEEGYVIVIKNNQVGLVDYLGNTIFETKYSKISKLDNGLYILRSRNNDNEYRWEIKDVFGNNIMPYDIYELTGSTRLNNKIVKTIRYTGGGSEITIYNCLGGELD